MRSLVRTAMLASVCALLAPAVGLSAQANPPAKSTWNLNLAKSNFGGGPAPKSVTVNAETLPNGTKFDIQGVGADGKPFTIRYTSTTDGKEFPVTGSANYDTEVGRRIDSTTTEMTRKKAGKVVETATNVISNGFKVATVTIKGTDAKGKKYARVEVYERQ